METAMEFRERGDTLVEVLMAIVVMGLVVTGSIVLMTQGLGAAQLAVEHTQVRLQVNAQIEFLQYLRDQYVKQPSSAGGTVWSDIATNFTNTTASVYGQNCDITPAKLTPTNKTFYVQKEGGAVVRKTFDSSIQPTTIALPGAGMWIEATNSGPSVTPAYIDFVIRACWKGTGSAPQQRTVTALRLYNPI